MKLQIVSDLHTEFRPVDVPVLAEVIVAAGDIGAGEHALPLIDRWIADGAEVVMVLGNHEFYGREYTNVIAEWRKHAEARANLHLLNRDSVQLDGVRFLGATLWTDFDGSRARALRIGEQSMNDFRIIRYRGPRFTPEDSVDLHHGDVDWLDQSLATAHDGPTVVVTHHLPHPGSVASQHIGSELNPAFVSNLTWLIEKHQPSLWVHGHTHTGCDYRVGDTRIVCNPLGYPGEQYITFDASMTVEV